MPSRHFEKVKSAALSRIFTVRSIYYTCFYRPAIEGRWILYTLHDIGFLLISSMSIFSILFCAKVNSDKCTYVLSLNCREHQICPVVELTCYHVCFYHDDLGADADILWFSQCTCSLDMIRKLLRQKVCMNKASSYWQKCAFQADAGISLAMTCRRPLTAGIYFWRKKSFVVDI